MALKSYNDTDGYVVPGNMTVRGILRAVSLALTGALTAASVTVTGMLRQGSTWRCWGGFQAAAEVITTGTVDTWVLITNATDDLWVLEEGDGFSVTDDVFTVVNAGTYLGHLSLALHGLSAKAFEVRIYNVTQEALVGYVMGKLQ